LGPSEFGLSEELEDWTGDEEGAFEERDWACEKGSLANKRPATGSTANGAKYLLIPAYLSKPSTLLKRGLSEERIGRERV